MNRRDLLKAGVSILPVASRLGIGGAVAAGNLVPSAEGATDAVAQSSPANADSNLPWQRRIRRVGQLNMTEHDPAVMNVEAWADFWASVKADVVFISVTGILAYYQTKVPFHRKGKFLGDRDFFGECCAAAKKRGMRVVARMSPDLNWDDCLEAHPDWFERRADGSPNRSHEEPRLIRTCMFTRYMTEYIPAIIREVNTTYDVDAFYCNGWPPLGELPDCHCSICKNFPPSGTPAYWDIFNDRMEFLWKTYDSLAKEKKSDSFFFANSGGGARSAMNLDRLGKLCDWFQGDNQGRGGQDEPVWLCTLQGRVATAIQEGKMATNITGTWSTGPVRWRNTAKSPQESMIWTSQTAAAGLVPYFHVIGAETGLGEDRRWQTLVKNYFDWSVKHDKHFANKRAIAKLGVVMGQRTHMFYKYPKSAGLNSALDEPTQQALNGMYYSLLEGRFLFDFVHEDRMDAERLSKYSALILPNVALLTDAQCDQLRAYVKSGGSLFATFETSMYDDRNQRRENFGLADVFGIQKSGDVIGTTGNGYYSRIERKHEILDGFTDTNWFMGAEHRLPIAPTTNPLLTVVPGFVAYPPELAYPPPEKSHTNEPAIVLSEQGKSRLAYFSGDIERTFWTSGQPDLSRLINNTIRWMLRDAQPVRVEGQGLIETFAWETEPGYALHVLNYTNPNTHRGWYRDFHPIGAQRVRFGIPAGRKVKRVQLLRAEKEIPFKSTGNGIEFTIPSVTEYEVAAIET
ncbi:MAG TPA: alpha-amylase family protein [Candidatus Acidoferrum sp.]|nr:alpha-amylase family protein [Candidatus Acidoferrum sp.]